MAAKQERWRELAEVKRELAERDWFQRLAAICQLRLQMSL